MCLSSTKQGFLLLEAFNRAKDEGLHWSELVEQMKSISTDTFGVDDYVGMPRGLVEVLRAAKDSDQIEPLKEGGGWRLTANGASNLDFLRTRYIDPYLSSQLAVPSAASAQQVPQ